MTGRLDMLQRACHGLLEGSELQARVLRRWIETELATLDDLDDLATVWLVVRALRTHDAVWASDARAALVERFESQGVWDGWRARAELPARNGGRVER